MKLLQQTGLYFLAFSTLVLLVGGTGLFYAVNYLFDYELDESLKHTRAVLYKELVKLDSLPLSFEIMDEVIDIHPVSVPSSREEFKDTLRLEKEENENKEFRQYNFTELIKGRYYRISLNHSKFESEHLATSILLLITGVLVLSFLLINLFNRFLSQSIWRPFYNSIDQIRNFNFSSDNLHESLPTKIEEFQILDMALKQMTEKIIRDYRSLEQFTENASHELQTPIAIIRSKIELLLQEEGHSEKELEIINQIQEATTKLTKLNQTLLLLTRIENRQFEQKEKVAFNDVVLKKLKALELLIADKSLEVITELDKVILEAHPGLVDILISNLLSNSIKHNLDNGKIEIRLTKEMLTIKNTGHHLALPPEKLFERFQKADDAAKSIGLGLSIVKEICKVYGWTINYENEKNWHLLELRFNPALGFSS